MITARQIKTLQIEARRLTKLSGGQFDEPSFRLLVRNAGRVRADDKGHVSTKQLDQAGFERVRALIEELLAKFDPAAGTYWREVAARHGRLASTRQLHEIEQSRGQLVAAGVDYRLGAIVRQMSGGATDNPRDLSVSEAAKVIEMLHAANRRQMARA